MLPSDIQTQSPSTGLSTSESDAVMSSSSSRQRSTVTLLTTVDAVSQPGETATERPLLVPDPNGASARGRVRGWGVMGLVIGGGILSGAVILGQFW